MGRESKAMPGYITEKILAVFLAVAIPIYWGTEEVFGIFNRKAFIFYGVFACTVCFHIYNRYFRNHA